MEATIGAPPTQQPTLGERLAVFRRFVYWLSIPAVIVFIGIATLAFVLPPTFRSSAVLLVEQQEIPLDMVRSTITTYVTQRFEGLQRRVLTRATILELIEKYDLYPEDFGSEPSEVLLQYFSDDLQIESLAIEVVDPRSGRPTQATSAFQLSFDNPSPTKAFATLNELISLLLEENARERAAQARGTSDFLQEEADRLVAEINEIGARLATFKEANVNNLPELLDLNYRMLEREERALEEVRRQVTVLDEQLVYLTAELEQIAPHEVIIGSDGQRILSPTDRLRQLETAFAQLISRYSEDHPDVVALQEEIIGLQQQVNGTGDSRALRAELANQRSELARIEQRYASDHPEVQLLEEVIRQLELTLENRAGTTGTDGEAPTNPAWVSMQARVKSAQVERQGLLDSAENLQQRIRQYERRIRQTPQIEREYTSLNQDYVTARQKYQEVRQRLMEAELAESLEQERKGERLVLIEPPLVPELPVSPNRPLLLGLAVVLAGVAGVGMVMVAQAFDGSVFGAQAVTSIVGAAPIGFIPVMYTPAELRRRRARWIWSAIIAVVVTALLLTGVHFLFEPLDELWYRLLDRLAF